MFRVLCAALMAAVVGVSGCARQGPPRRYELTGQVLAVQQDRSELTVRHDDIPGFMDAMTMTYQVVPASLLNGRKPGELIAATLEVDGTVGRLVAITQRCGAPDP